MDFFVHLQTETKTQNMNKKFSLLLLISIFSTLNIYAEVYEGSCGTNVRYSLDTSTGVLNITGTGAMTNYSSSSSVPWDSYRSYIKTVEISDGLSSIGEKAFRYCSNLTSVKIPNSVTGIGRYAFADCTSLTSVKISDNLTSIEQSTFESCSSLTSITVPNSVTSIIKYAFRRCTSLTSVVLGNNVTSIGNDVFSGCSSLTDMYNYAENIPTTDYEAFNSQNLSTSTLHVPASVLEAYKTTAPWSQFGTIEAIPDGVLRGDANSDGEVNTNDAGFIVNYILGTPDPTFNKEAADANQDGEIGMPDVMYIINHNLNGKFPEEKEKSMVLHHSDGTESLIELSTKPLIKFLDDKVQITTNVSAKEYSQDDILSVTYKDDENNEANIGIASGTIGEAFYIYRNDGEINGFVRSDVDSIAYSRYDANSIKHSKIVTQIVYTNDSVYWIPLAVIDSVSFVTPKTTYQPGVINLSERLMPYIAGCDSLTISLSASTPSDIIPRVGDKLVTTEMNELFPIGFAGEVTAVNGTEIICKSVLLEEVFETYYNVSSVYGYVEEEEQQQSSARGIRTNINSIDGKWDRDFTINTIPISYDREISRNVKPYSDLALKGGSGFSVELKPTVHVHVMLIINKTEGTYLQASVRGNLNFTEKLSVYGGLEWSHDFQISKLRVERPVCPYVNFFFEPGLFIRANALASASVTASQDYSFWWTRDWSSRGRNVIRPSAGGRHAGSSVDIEGCIDGSVAAGGYVDIGLALVNSALDKISLRGDIGAEFVGHAMLYNNDIANAEKGTGVYERFRQSSFELNAFVNTSCNLKLAGGLWGASAPLPWNLSGNINTWDVVPTFSDMKFKQKSNDATKADASASVSGKCLFPVQIGFSVRDENNEEVDDFWDSSSFRNKNRTMTETFSGLSSTGKYTLYPKVKAFGIIDMLASPSEELERSEFPVEITEFKQTNSEYKANGFNYNGSYYDYKYSCSVTVCLTNSDNIEDWGYVYEDMSGNTSLISLKNYSSPYTDSRYVYYRNEPSSYVRLYEYVKYKNDNEYYYGEAHNYPIKHSITSCPDNNHPHMIDLGLPSGTKWACCNVGASTPEGYGNYYAWGETSTKSVYSWETYLHTGKNIGNDIAGTQYDAATVNWGSPWRMPNLTQVRELISLYSEVITQNGVKGQRFTGKNGGKIFLPFAGEYEMGGAANVGHYWSSKIDEHEYYKDSNGYYTHAYHLELAFGFVVMENSSQLASGLSVRPVR